VEALLDSDQRRRQILDAALGVFANKGYHGSSVTDIIMAAGIARGTFYLHFESKRSIFDAILGAIFEKVNEQILPVLMPRNGEGEGVRAQVEGNARRVCRLFLENRDLVRILMAEAAGLDEQASARLVDFYGRLGLWMAESLQDGVDAGIVRPCDTTVAAHALIGAIRGVFWAWAMDVIELDEDTFVGELMALLNNGILVAPS
jgi:AcrR family transcriptional regulator